MSTTIELITGDSTQVLKQYPDNHFHSVVTDPPYGIEFLGKDWDKHTGTVATVERSLPGDEAWCLSVGIQCSTDLS